ncbi:MAG: helix-turn-helix transcriptional regulator [Prevotella sp.]|nr:helix-turn-helix transcriptional regulator [Prevotella sp.]
MYNLQSYLQAITERPTEELPFHEFFCSETNLEQTLLTNKMQETLAAFSYTLIRQGTLHIVYNRQPITLRSGDLYFYSPGMQISITSGSDDYRGICLIADEDVTFESTAVHTAISTAFLPTAEVGKPVIHLNDQQAEMIGKRMTEISLYQNTPHRHLAEGLRTLYSMFIFDLMDIVELGGVEKLHVGERSVELFDGFMRLVSRHFAEHHDIGFYASELCITTTHLSRIVRQHTGRTVVDYINRLLILEASWLLLHTDQTITTIAEQLHFANQHNFSRFFTRLKGISPKAYRMKR